ncbi:MAG: DUF2934 domain-containing protein [Spirochaetales bacterium]|nr:DUF2934 domain-containing protein [Spirochaetales bacterium]
MLINEDLISTDENELNCFLKGWGKKQTKKNRTLLINIIEKFRSVSSYSPHNKDSFNRYVKTKKIKSLFDSPGTENKQQNSPHQSKIQKKAHEIYVQRVKDAIPGNAFADWLQAEKEIKKETK